MDILLRLLLRLILVPLGYLAAVLAGFLVIVFGPWRLGEMMTSTDPNTPAWAFFGLVFAGPFLVAMLAFMMWLPASIGILLAEAFAIRSWIYHAANGAISAWLGWTRRRFRLLGGGRLERRFLETGIPTREQGHGDNARHARCRNSPVTGNLL
jgi:hypothetical protein